MSSLSRVGQCRSAASQLCGTLPYNCLRFTSGTAMGFQITLLAVLYNKDSEIVLSMGQLTWLASLSFLTPVGSVCTGLLTQRLGNRAMGLATAALFVASGLLYYSSSNAGMLFAATVLTKIAATNTLAVPYISEISEPRLRSRLLAVCQMAHVFGSFFSLLLGSLAGWRCIALVNLAFPIAAAALLVLTPNSPAWLAGKGRLAEAERALCWLRGWAQPSQVQREFGALLDSADASSRAAPEPAARLSRSLRPFARRSFCLPLGTMCMVFLLHEVTGAGVIHGFSAIIFAKIDSPIEPSIATVILGAMGVLGNLIVLLFVHRTGKRKLALFSVLVIGLCYASIAAVNFFQLRGNYLWIPPIAVILANFADITGIGTIMYMIISEIFPSPVRYIGTSLAMSINMIMMSLMNKSFLYVVDAITLPLVFLIFASMNIVALVCYYFLFPETEGKSLDEIQHHFQGNNAPREPAK